VEQIAPELPL